MIEQLKKQIFSLRLLGISAAIERRLAETEGLSHAEFLAIVLGDEELSRRQASAKRLIHRAHFTRECSLEEWDSSFDRGITKTKIRELASFGFYHARTNLIILGKTGEGKSHLGMALGRRLCQEGLSAQFHSTNLLFEVIAAERAAGTYLKWLAHIHSAKVLILDDFGLRRYNHDEASCLMDILEGRYQRTCQIITSQVDPKGWLKLFEDSVIAEAIVDRLTKPSETIKLRGGSYRERLDGPRQQKPLASGAKPN
ncbi:MAG: ATP-binding protein [Proteobacteria bacterium]|nr:ATP-binding protein [Pseudomonadota bacterium]